MILRLLGGRSAYRADIRAGTALEAGICIDNILSVSHRDCIDRTFRCAGAAADALVTDNICH